MTKYLPAILAAAGFFLSTADQASAFPRTRESADLTITFDLAAPAPTEPVDPNAPPVTPATGTATVDVTRTNGVETDSDVSFTFTGLTDGTYNVDAILKTDDTETPTPVALGQITVAAGAATLTLPTTVDALEIATLNVSTPADPNVVGSTATVVLTGTPTEDITTWKFFGNRPVVADPSYVPVPAIKKNGKPAKVKRIHGHVLIQAKIYDNVEKRRKFLLVAHNGPANTTLTIKLDGVEVGTFTTKHNGKMMVKGLEGDFRIAGTHIMEICDSTGAVIAIADFFPTVEDPGSAEDDETEGTEVVQ